MNELLCPKCGCKLGQPEIGRNSGKWFVKHVHGSLLPGELNWCPYIGKHWGFHDTKELAVAAVLSDESSWRPLTHEALEFTTRLVDIEIDKARREGRKGYMAT